MEIIEFIKQPWHWALAGTVIAAVKFMLLFFGQSFGFSSNLRTICAVCGAGNTVDFFKFDWKSQTWNLVFLVGAVLGGVISHQYLSINEAVQIADSTIADLQKLNIAAPTGLQPNELFSIETLFTFKGFSILAIGGLLIGFGTRYAGGCTSGHAISGLSNLQLPSLIAVIGFFIGGLIMTFLIFPLIF